MKAETVFHSEYDSPAGTPGNRGDSGYRRQV